MVIVYSFGMTIDVGITPLKEFFPSASAHFFVALGGWEEECRAICIFNSFGERANNAECSTWKMAMELSMYGEIGIVVFGSDTVRVACMFIR